MTPEGQTLAAWITFSAYRDGDEVVAQARTLGRTSDPFIELSYLFGANRANEGLPETTLANLARSVGVEEPRVETTELCLDRRRQWKYAGNVRRSAAVTTAASTVTAPARRVRRRRVAS